MLNNKVGTHGTLPNNAITSRKLTLFARLLVLRLRVSTPLVHELSESHDAHTHSQYASLSEHSAVHDSLRQSDVL